MDLYSPTGWRVFPFRSLGQQSDNFFIALLRKPIFYSDPARDFFPIQFKRECNRPHFIWIQVCLRITQSFFHILIEMGNIIFRYQCIKQDIGLTGNSRSPPYFHIRHFDLPFFGNTITGNNNLIHTFRIFFHLHLQFIPRLNQNIPRFHPDKRKSKYPLWCRKFQTKVPVTIWNTPYRGTGKNYSHSR